MPAAKDTAFGKDVRERTGKNVRQSTVRYSTKRVPQRLMRALGPLLKYMCEVRFLAGLALSDFINRSGYKASYCDFKLSIRHGELFVSVDGHRNPLCSRITALIRMLEYSIRDDSTWTQPSSRSSLDSWEHNSLVSSVKKLRLGKFVKAALRRLLCIDPNQNTSGRCKLKAYGQVNSELAKDVYVFLRRNKMAMLKGYVRRLLSGLGLSDDSSARLRASAVFERCRPYGNKHVADGHVYSSSSTIMFKVWGSLITGCFVCGSLRSDQRPR